MDNRDIPSVPLYYRVNHCTEGAVKAYSRTHQSRAVRNAHRKKRPLYNYAYYEAGGVQIYRDWYDSIGAMPC